MKFYGGGKLMCASLGLGIGTNIHNLCSVGGRIYLRGAIRALSPNLGIRAPQVEEPKHASMGM